MRKTPSKSVRPLKADSLYRLRSERRKLVGMLAKLDAEMVRRESPLKKVKPTIESLDRWFAELSEGLPNLAPVPENFSRADIYDNHD